MPFAGSADVNRRLTIRLLSLTLLVAVWFGCSDGPTAPTITTSPSLPPEVNLTGTWQGQYVEVGCQSTTCPVCCTSRGKVERRRDLTLVMTQDGATVSGRWTEAPVFGQGTLAGTFSGTVSGRSLTLAGALFVAATNLPSETLPYRLTEFAAQASGPTGPLTGTFQIVTIDATGRETERLRNDIVGLTRVP